MDTKEDMKPSAGISNNYLFRQLIKTMHEIFFFCYLAVELGISTKTNGLRKRMRDESFNIATLLINHETTLNEGTMLLIHPQNLYITNYSSDPSK
jgi:hypothetical protein